MSGMDAEDIKDIDYSKLPPHMQEAARAYIERRRSPGHFLQAVLRNDLVGAFGHADEINKAAMFQWAQWLYNEAPMAAWGSREKLDAWLKGETNDYMDKE